MRMIFSCPNTSCSQYNKALHAPLAEIMDYMRDTDTLKISVQCPHCFCILTVCENCLSLCQLPTSSSTEASSTLQKHVQFIFCSVCGNNNMLCPKLRNCLMLNGDVYNNYPTSFQFDRCNVNCLRLVQRLINPNTYLSSKMEEYKRIQESLAQNDEQKQSDTDDELRHRDITKLKLQLALLQRQMQQFTSNDVLISDYAVIRDIFSCDSHVNEFTISHLNMLESLYEVKEIEESMPDFFNDVRHFLQNINSLIEWKKNIYFYNCSVWNEPISLNIIASKDLNINGHANEHNIIVRLLEAQKKQKEKAWYQMTEPYFRLIGRVNLYLTDLLNQLSESLHFENGNTCDNSNFGKNIISLNTVPFSEQYLVHHCIEQEALIEKLKNRIILLRKLSKQLSIVI